MKERFRTFCTGCGTTLTGGFLPFCPSCGAMADIEYDLAQVTLRDSPNPYLRFSELLPVANPELLPATAEFTPAIHARQLGAEVGLPWLYLKNETVLPTGTTKDRMAAVALPYLYEHGVCEFATSSTGNSSTAYASALDRLPDLLLHLFTASQFESRVWVGERPQVAHYVLSGASFVEAFDAAGDFARRKGIVSERGFFNPGRREGLKLAYLEAAEQVPRPIDAYVQAVSSAMGVYGVHRGAEQLCALGLAPRVPRLICVQQESCAPMVTAFRDGCERIRPQDIIEHPAGIAQAILRGNPARAYPHVRRIVLESGGTFAAVSEREIRRARTLVERLEGIRTCFAAAAAVAGAAKMREAGELSPQETVLVNLTGRERPPARRSLRAQRLVRTGSGWAPAVSAAVPAVGPPL